MTKNKIKFIQKQWPILIMLVIVAIVIFTRFYDTPADNVDIARIAGADVLPDIDVEELEIDLDNLSEEEIASVSAFLKFKKIKAAFIPTGVPDIYGAELNVSFDQVQDAINKVRVFGPTYGEEEQKIVLTGADLERYKKLGASIACEYCCGVKTLTKEDGSAACGCAHSIMMRGLAAYLIKNHPEISDKSILEELVKWKVTYFPKQTLSVKLKELEEAGEVGIKELLQEFPDFLPQMVGGC